MRTCGLPRSYQFKNMTKQDFERFHRALDHRIIGFNSAIEFANGEPYNDGRIFATKSDLRNYVFTTTGKEPQQVYLHTYRTLLDDMFAYNDTWILDKESGRRFREALAADLRYQPGILIVDTNDGMEMAPEWNSEIGPSSDLRPRIEGAVVGYGAVDTDGEFIFENGELWLFGKEDECRSFHLEGKREVGVRGIRFPEFLQLDGIGIGFRLDAIANERASVLRFQMYLLKIAEEFESRDEAG